MLGHLRPVKDPFRTALAAARLLGPSVRSASCRWVPPDLPTWPSRPLAEAAASRRYRWLGDLPRWKALRVLARCRLLVLTSLMEGGANVISEAIAARVPVLSSHIAGSVGILGAAYPGYFPVGDAAGAWHDLLEQAEGGRGASTRTLYDWCGPPAAAGRSGEGAAKLAEPAG